MAAPSSVSAPRAPRARDLAVVAASFAATLLAIAALVWGRRDVLRAGLPELLRQQDAPAAGLAAWRQRPATPATVKAVMFGDSLAFCPGAGTVGGLVHQRLLGSGLDLDFGEVRNGAYRPPVHRYHLAGVLEGAPRIAILELNARSLGESAPPVRSMRLEALSAKLPLSDIWHARAALHADGLSLVDPLVHRLLAWLDLDNVTVGLEELARTTFETWGARVNTLLGLTPSGPRIMPSPAMKEAVERSVRERYCGDLSSRAMTPVVADLVDRLRAAGVAIVAYVSPMALTSLRSSAPCLDERLPQRLEEVRVALGLAPAEWLDLHALVREPALFRDLDGHLTAAGCTAIADVVAERVRERLAEAAPVQP